MVFGPFFYLGYYMERETMQRLLQNRYRRAVVPMAGLLAVGILVFGQRLEDPLSMVYENFSYYELENVRSGLLVRLILLLVACILSWALLFFCAAAKDADIGSRAEYDAGLYAASHFSGYSDVLRYL